VTKKIYNYQLSREAELDIEDGYFWYENQTSGLGEELLESLNTARKAILDNPTTYRIIYKKKVRKFVLGRFPYLILYIVEAEDINVISVFNTNLHPRKWKERTRNT